MSLLDFQVWVSELTFTSWPSHAVGITSNDKDSQSLTINSEKKYFPSEFWDIQHNGFNMKIYVGIIWWTTKTDICFPHSLLSCSLHKVFAAALPHVTEAGSYKTEGFEDYTVVVIQANQDKPAFTSHNSPVSQVVQVKAAGGLIFQEPPQTGFILVRIQVVCAVVLVQIWTYCL